MIETQTNKLVVINNGRCGQNSGILREKFTADVLQVRPKPDYVFLSDGVHLTLPGNKLLARTFLDVIAPPLRGGETIVCVGDSLTYGYLNQGAGSAEGETYPAMLRQGRHE